MKKTYSKADLKEKAAKVLEQYPNDKEVFATVDGNIFRNKNHAGLHAGAKGTVYTFERETPTKEDTNADETKTKVSAVDAIGLIENAATIEELEALGFEADDRKTVAAAYAKKKEEFTTNTNE
ncbi:hypothetical protein NBRC110019_07470 [Neptunitalea chrysea]|uniref:Uncharacterized protein n=1 Tax=Neptunitalea chrysea TaxID=1647581 RepID=A0A9W6B389_9FLAO|nr:hypothetical protein [Neptunitalea chrysea]GLB51708.1 hypothetical protein NBRC110019_07470 [Neptunitalea chrysea]